MTDAVTPPLLWNPSERFLAGTNHARYLRWLAAERGQDFPIEDYDALWRWSVTDLDGFWRSIWDHFGVVADGDPRRFWRRARCRAPTGFPTPD